MREIRTSGSMSGEGKRSDGRMAPKQPRLSSTLPLRCPAMSASGTDRRSACRSQGEHVEHRGRRRILELGRVRDNVVRLARADQHGDVLFPVHRKTYGWGVDSGAGIEAPKLLEGS